MEEENGAMVGREFCEGPMERLLEEVEMAKNWERDTGRARREAASLSLKEMEEEEDYYCWEEKKVKEWKREGDEVKHV